MTNDPHPLDAVVVLGIPLLCLLALVGVAVSWWVR